MSEVTRELPRLLEGHDAISVGTRDAALRPFVTLAAGVSFAAGEGRVTVYVPEATGAETLANLAANGMVAVVFEQILSHHTVQVKGRVADVRPAAESDRAFVERSAGSFFAQIEAVGGIPNVVRKKRTWPCRAVTFEVTDVFEQTPGPKAGTPLVLEAGR